MLYPEAALLEERRNIPSQIQALEQPVKGPSNRACQGCTRGSGANPNVFPRKVEELNI
jgi:hypothetical protein